VKVGEVRVTVAELKNTSLNERAVYIIVFQDDVFAQNFDRIVLSRTFDFCQQNLRTE